MATRAVEIAAPVRGEKQHSLPTFCHFTTLHANLKGRSYHMQFFPLAAAGAKVRYVSPLRIHGRHDGVDFVSLPLRQGWLRHLLAVPSLLKILLKQNAGIYHFQDPELLPVGFLLKLIFHKRVVYDCYEDFSSMAYTKRGLPNWLQRPAASLVAAILGLAARCFDGLMTADPLTLKKMALEGGSRKLTFYNFPNLDFFPPPRLGGTKVFDLVYRGGLSERAGVWLLLEAMHALAVEGTKARLLLIGYCDDSSAETALRDKIRALDLSTSVEIMGRIQHGDMARTLSRARIGISPLRDIPKFRNNIPVKVFEYWACGLPVISSDLPPIRPFFKNVNGGLLFPPGDAQSLAQSIAWLLDHPKTAAWMGQHGRAAVVHRFNHAREVEKLRRFFCAIDGKSNSGIPPERQ
jgi:glycosyltransferase involved in cell wall biosynthesis